MNDIHWMDLSDGFDEPNSNTKSGISFGHNGEDMTPSSSDNILKLNDSYVQEDVKFRVSDDSNAGRKKKTSRIIGWGLRRFSTIVCRKVQDKGSTTYNEVADEIIAELTSGMCFNEQFDEKNIRRRVYDAFNVLIAINVIAKDKKEIRWTGFPITKSEQSRHLEETRRKLTSRIQAKTKYLEELEHQLLDLQNLVLRNRHLHDSGKVASEGVHLPFVLVRTHPKANVEIEISEDMRLVHFEFNESPYRLYDEQAILKMMRHPQAAESEQASTSSSNESVITDRSGMPLKPSSFSWNSERMRKMNPENTSM